jgi:lipoprotein-anchoring transpeptidase ErfK/SrfK
MRYRTLLAIAIAAVAAIAAQTVGAQPPAPPTAAPPVAGVAQDALQLQVMLDRAGFSPGVIDGRMGANTRRALTLLRENGGGNDQVPPLTTYTITADDERGPYGPVPSDLVEQAELETLGYQSVVEALAERFHTTPALLERLNPGAAFREGEQIQVPNVIPLVVPIETVIIPATPAPESARRQHTNTGERTAGTSGASPERDPILDRPDVVVSVSKEASALTVRDGSDTVVFFAPVTTGSERDPLPIGEWKVTGIHIAPKFHYNPELFWDADPSHSKATIQPGPNNPVGLVWIDLSKEHYGIHGTPEPSAIGRTQSHGCVRLTNWDALKLSGMVKPGTRVIFTK